jgi:transcriptional regulator with XRE-family HTH domain
MTASHSDRRHSEPAVLNRLAPDRTGPTVLRMLLGAQLRRLREAKGITLERAGYQIRASHSKMSRLELGRVSFKERDVADLLTLYEVTDEHERETLCALARQANGQGWWHSYSDILPQWFEFYVGLERAADRIRTYQVQFVPGLLQTEDYARGVVLLEHADDPADEIARRVTLRMTRQKLLTGPDVPEFWAVMDDAALRRPIGGPEVMRGQLRYLIEVAELPNVTLQVIPFGAGGHAAAGGPFSILRFPEPDLPDVVYLEQLTSALYLDKHEDTDHYLAVMERLCLEALPADQTVSTLRGLLQELS